MKSSVKRLLWRLLPALVITSLVVACFDESTYKGGGRRDQRAETNQEEEEDSGILPLPDTDGGQTNRDSSSPATD